MYPSHTFADGFLRLLPTDPADKVLCLRNCPHRHSVFWTPSTPGLTLLRGTQKPSPFLFFLFFSIVLWGEGIFVFSDVFGPARQQIFFSDEYKYLSLPPLFFGPMLHRA
jgi:hypothetical protein